MRISATLARAVLPALFVAALFVLPAAEVNCQEPAAEGEAEEAAERRPDKWSFDLGGEIVNYFVAESRAYFGERERHWLETSAALTAKLSYKKFTAEVSGIGVKTTGLDAFGTGTRPAGSPPGTPAPGTFPDFYVDKAYVQLDGIAGLPLKATLGRQHIQLGSQFLVGDGVYDGFAPNARQAVYHNPRRGFDALRVEWDVKGTHFDSFVFRVHPTWDGGGGRDGLFGGLDVSRKFARTGGTYAAGLFYRSSPSGLDNSMAVLNLRAEQPLDRLRKGLYAGGEFVAEFAGRCRNAFYCTTAGQGMNERAWHAEVGYEAKEARRRPFAEVGYVYYSKDFTPVAPGFSDWGKWYLGNQIDWIIFGTNTKVFRAQAGFRPRPGVKLRAQYHNTRQAQPTGMSTGGSLSDEFTFIAEWYPRDGLWFNAAVGASLAGRALAPSGLANPFAALNSGAAVMGTRNSVDVVIATGWRF